MSLITEMHPLSETDLVCASCGSNHIHINMFFDVRRQQWEGDPDHPSWCNECCAEEGYVPRDEYEEEKQ